MRRFQQEEPAQTLRIIRPRINSKRTFGPSDVTVRCPCELPPLRIYHSESECKPGRSRLCNRAALGPTWQKMISFAPSFHGAQHSVLLGTKFFLCPVLAGCSELGPAWIYDLLASRGTQPQHSWCPWGEVRSPARSEQLGRTKRPQRCWKY